jgi:hypothetical protein
VEALAEVLEKLQVGVVAVVVVVALLEVPHHRLVVVAEVVAPLAEI